jgi:hypothetical protein
MATRRKYRPKGYRSGGAVMADTPIAESSDELSVHSDHADPAPVAVTADAPAPPPEIADGVPPPTPEAHDAVARALEAQRRAEELQRQPLQPPQLSERRIAFIRQHPELNDRANEEAVIGYWKQGLRLGIPDDTDEIDNYVLHGLRFERAAREQRHGEAQTEQAAPAAPQTRPEASQQRPMPAPPARRSMPMVAPYPVRSRTHRASGSNR